jgi:hypothetical protein
VPRPLAVAQRLAQFSGAHCPGHRQLWAIREREKDRERPSRLDIDRDVCQARAMAIRRDVAIGAGENSRRCRGRVPAS